MKKQIQIVDFNSCQYSRRHATYGGKAGTKAGIIYNDENWLIKYPKSTKSMRNIEDLSYTTASLSEFLGSHIYGILGIDVHETLLGIRDNKVVVACKDFCEQPGCLLEMRVIKNAHNEELGNALEKELSSTHGEHMVSLENILIHLNMNPVLSPIKGLKERFWDCVVIDGFINNNDRNNGNWGMLLQNDGSLKLAPVYDNGAAFSNKLSDVQLEKRMQHDDRIVSSSLAIETIYSLNGEQLSFKNVLLLENEDLKDAIVRNAAKIKEKLDEIKEFMNSVPESYQGFSIMSPARKEFYIRSMEIRFEKLIEPRAREIMLERGGKSIKDRIASAREKVDRTVSDKTDMTKDIER